MASMRKPNFLVVQLGPRLKLMLGNGSKGPFDGFREGRGESRAPDRLAMHPHDLVAIQLAVT